MSKVSFGLTLSSRMLVLAGMAAASLLGSPLPAKTPMFPLNAAQAAPAASGAWTQTEWSMPNATLGVAASGTNQYFRPSSVSSYGQLVGTFGVCAGAGAWCQGPGDSAAGQTLRLAGNHKSDAANPYSSDLNGDGVSELLFANLYNGSTHVFNGGWIYWGQGAPTSPTWSASQRTDLPTWGANSAAVADLNGDGRPELIFGSWYDDITYNTNSIIYWGQAGGAQGVQYSAAASLTLPTSGVYSLAVADLNSDGRPEVIFANYQSPSSVIYWGQAGGPQGVTYSAIASTTLPASNAAGLAIADLNGDGRPEVIVSNWGGGYSAIFWGQAGGPYGVQYSAAISASLPTSVADGVSAADLNGDGRPEVIFANRASGNSAIYWGQAGGPHGVQYSPAAYTNLPGDVPTKVSVADLNNDGQRDVVIQNHEGGFTRVFTGLLPLSGAATISWTLPMTFGFRSLSLSDLNGDGRIDLLTGQQGEYPNPWNGGTSGRVYLHTGNASAPYTTTPSFNLPVQSSPAAYASFGPGRGANGDRFSQARPVYGTAFPNYGVLESMVMDSGQAGTVWQSVSATTQISSATGITLFVAASDNLAALSSPSWTQVGAMGNGSWTQAISGVGGRYARYRVILWRDRTTEASPALQDITFNYATQAGAFNKTSPANGAFVNSTNVTVQWGASPNAANYQVCRDSSINNSCDGSWHTVGNVTSFAFSGLSNTTHEWQVRACWDSGCTLHTYADGSVSNFRTFVVDTVAPATAIGAITPEYRNTPPQLFYAPTSDGGSPFSTVRLLTRQDPISSWTDSAAFTNGMAWTPPAQGRWYVASKVTDQAGNVEPDPTGATEDATFFYDTIAPLTPTVSAVGPANSRTPNVAWSASSDPGEPTTGSGVQTYRALILWPDNSLVTQFDVPAPITNTNVNVSLPDGDYIARVAAIDRAGNQSAYSSGFPFSVDSATTFGGVVYSDTAPLGQYNSESGVAAVPVTLTQPTSAVSATTTSALGDYSFGGFTAPGYYTLSIGTPAGYVRTTPDEVRRLVVVGSDFPNIHFGLRYIGNQNTQFLWVNAQCTDGSPFPGAPFTVEGPALNTTAATGAGGGWAAEVSQPGVYTVTLIDTGIPLVAPGNVNPVAVTVPADGSGGATFVLACSDINEGTGGIVVRLFDADNPAATPALYAGLPVTASNGISALLGTSNAAGYVSFAGLISGTWVVTGPVVGGQWLVTPGFEAYAQTVNVIASLASQVRYGYRSQNAAAVATKAAEDLTDNGALYVGDVIRYTLSVTNNTGITLTTVRLTDTLPVGLSFNGIESAQPAGCSGGGSAGQVLGLCAALGPGEVMRVAFTATVTGTGALMNSFVWSADQVGEQPGATCTNAPCGGANPRVGVNSGTRKEAMPTVARMGELVSYTIVLSNAGAVGATVDVTDTLAVSATLESATPGYSQVGQTLAWSGVNVPAGGTVALTITVRAGSGPLPGGYTLANSVLIGAADGQIVRDAPGVTVEPWRAFVPVVVRP